jgi:sterol desaturase/sphingolipid hydroxylase (fatty acid hydroxylase superfamily)
MPVLVAGFVALFVMEGRRQLRKRKQPRLQRLVINSLVSVPAFSLLRFLFLPSMIRLARSSRQLKMGLNYQFDAPPLVKDVVSFLLLDYSNYLWHLLLHKIPLLWRFHVVHHSDPDLDVSTAIRFHFGEIIGSLFYRGAWVFITGVRPITVLVYEICFEGATQFHHSNWKLPLRTERLLNKMIVTPRMHGIHHSIVERETDSNYAVIFSFWDRLHQTIRLNVRQDMIVTGVPAYSDPAELTIGYLLKLPFTKMRKAAHIQEERESVHGNSTMAE